MRRLILVGITSALLAGCAQTRSTLTISDDTFNVYVADSAAERSQGLGEIEHLASDEGMVFVFPTSAQQTFWMKGVEYPIDIVWVDDSQVLGWVTATPGNLTLYPSPGEVNMVLELPAGTAKDIGLTVGGIVILNEALDGY